MVTTNLSVSTTLTPHLTLPPTPRRWVHLYTHHLQEKVVNSIGELYTFMNASNDTLDLKVRRHACSVVGVRC